MEDQKLPCVLIDCIGEKHGVYEDHAELLKEHFCLITMKEYNENKKILGKKIRAIYMWYHKPVINEELLQSLPNLKIVASSGVGIDHLDLNLLSRYGVKVSNTPFIVSTDTADLGMALMLASSRRLVEGNWNTFSLFKEKLAVQNMELESVCCCEGKFNSRNTEKYEDGDVNLSCWWELAHGAFNFWTDLLSR